MQIEQRFLNAADFKAEWRIEKREGKPSLIYGYPAKFNRKSLDLGGFREQIKPGAFSRTLAEGADVRGLINHNADLILGRTSTGTMRLREDNIGLRMEIDPPDTQMARDYMTLIERGDINQGSFKFRTKTDDWRMVDGEVIRDLIDVDLLDASIVTFPAYEDTSAGVRSILGGTGGELEIAKLEGVIVRIERKLTVSADDRELLLRSIRILEGMNSRLDAPGGSGVHYLEAAKRRLALAERE